MPQFSLLHLDDSGRIRRNLSCTNCSLADASELETNCMSGVGPTPSKLMFVGYAPASEDDQRGLPMTGKGGRIFRELLLEAGITPSEVYITNVLKCAPFDAKVKDTHLNACLTHLKHEIKKVQPEAIIAVGSPAFHWLTGQSGATKFRKHGVHCKFAPETFVYPIKQPAAIFHGEEAEKTRTRREILDDLLWLKEKLETGTLRVADEIETDYQVAKEMDDVHRFIAEIDAAEIIAVDLENGTPLGQGALFPEEGTIPIGFGFSTGPGHGRAIPLYAWGTSTLYYWTEEEIKEIFDLLRPRLTKKPLFGQNWLQYDQKWLKHFFGVHRSNVVFDTMLAHYLVDEEKGTHGLEALAVRYTKMPPWKRTFTVKDAYGMGLYLCKDVDATFRVKGPIEAEMTEKQKGLLKNLLIPLAHELCEMEYTGVTVDEKNLEKVATEISRKMEEETNKMRDRPEIKAWELRNNTTFKPTNQNQLGIVMDELKFPVISRTSTGKYSTGKETMAALSVHKDPRISEFVLSAEKLKRLDKLRGTYVDGMRLRLKKDRRIHTSYLIPGTTSGRLSSSDPNLQNIPTKGTAGKSLDDGSIIKGIFGTPPGYALLMMDYSQAELRTLAMYSKDPGLIEIFRQGLDAHAATAAKAYAIPIDQVTDEQRRFAKTINFGVIYGMSEMMLVEKFISSGASRADAEEFLKVHKREFKTVWEWMDEQEATIRRDRQQETYFGRIRHYGVIDDHAIRVGYNFPIQSTASDFTLYALVRSAKALRALGYDAYPILTVHDSCGYYCRLEDLWDVAEIVKEIVENLGFPWMNVPLKADFEAGLNWGKMKKLDFATRSFK